MNGMRTGKAVWVFSSSVVLAVIFTLTALGTGILFLDVPEAAAGAYLNVAHSDPDSGAQHVYSPTLPNDATDTGSCQNCHMEHASWNGGAGSVNLGAGYESLNMANNDLLAAGICYQCHTNAFPQGAWPGRAAYNASRHGSAAGVVWPGANPAARTGGEVNLCINCHNPHGRSIADADNLTHAGSGWSPATIAWKDMLVRQEENLCLTCHDGAPAATNINATLALGANDGTNFYNHPISRSAAANDRTPYYHTGDETGSALTSTDRHVECEDCHNPHMALAGTSALEDSRAGGVLTGAWGVKPSAAWPGIPATTKDGDGANYTNDMPAAPAAWTSETITTGSPEFYLCLRCHSSYSQSAAGAWPSGAAPNLITDVSREINPNNLAHHAIAAKGKLQSTKVPYGNFVNGWDTQSLVTCSNCHSYKTSVNPRGPHGSANKWILNDYDTTAVGLPDNGNKNFCFNCHNYAVYYDGASIAGKAQARVDHPISGNHTDATVTITGIWCQNCHGGRTNGGMHGTSWGGFAATGATNPGEHFMNGAMIRGFTYNTGANKVACWTDNAAQQASNPYNLGCTRGHGGTTEPVNYDY